MRAISTANNNFRFASTAPFYVEDKAGKKMISRSSCRFFIDWLDERAASIKLEDAEQRNAVTKYIETARKFWKNQLIQANAE